MSWQCTPLILNKRDRQAFSLHRLCYLKLEMDPRDGQKSFFDCDFLSDTVECASSNISLQMWRAHGDTRG